MRTVKIFHNEADFEVFELSDSGFIGLLRRYESEIASGYRLYDGVASEATDITTDYNALAECKEIVMLQPAKGPLPIAIGIFIATLVISAVAVKLLTPKVDAPENSNRSQSSSTNALGQRENTVRLGERIDDPWGKVSYLTPSLIQVPHSRFESNQEVENFAMAIMGKGLQENYRDGDTLIERIPGASINSWNPGSDLSAAPDLVPEGSEIINLPLHSISRSNELQSQELLPPNDTAVGGEPTWTVTSTTNTGVFTLTNAGSLDVDLTEEISIGDELLVVDSSAIISTVTTTLYKYVDPDYIGESFSALASVEGLDGTYEVTGVTSNTITVDTSDAFWQTFTNKPLLITYYNIKDINNLQQSVLDSKIKDEQWYKDDLGTNPMTYLGSVTRDPTIGTFFNQAAGPIRCRDNSDFITLNFVADSGYYNILNGNEKSITANINIILQELDELGVITGNERTFNVPFSTNSQSKTKQAAITYDIDNRLPPFLEDVWYERAQLIVRRTTNRDKSPDVVNVDKVVWRDLYFRDEVDSPDNTDVTIIQAQIPSSPVAKSVKQRLINLDWTRIHTPYIGGGQFGVEQPVSTWAETLIGMALDKYNGRLTLENIDADTLLDIQDEIISYYGTSDAAKVGYDFDSTKIRFQDAYKLLCNAVNVKAYAQGGTFKGYADIDRTESSKQFTHRNKIPNTDTRTRSYESEFDGVELTFRNDKTGKFEDIILHVNGVDSFNRLSIELSGAITKAQADIRAHRELNIIKYQKYNYSFESDGIGRLTVLGERVDNVDYTRVVKREDNLNKYSIYSGYVVDQAGLEIELSEPVEFDDGAHSIRFTKRKGEIGEVIGCSQGSSKYHVILDGAPAEPIYTGYKGERTAFTFASDSQRNSLPVIIRSSKAKDKNGIKVRQLSAVNYDERYYQNDKDYLEG